MPIAHSTTRSMLGDRAAIAKLIARTATIADINAGDGRPSVRFCVISCRPGAETETETVSTDIAKVLGLKTLDIRLANMAANDIEEGAPLYETLRRTLQTFGDTFILCSEAGFDPASPLRTTNTPARPALRETIKFLAAQNENRGYARRTWIVLINTYGPAADVIEIVRQVTNIAPVGFLVLE